MENKFYKKEVSDGPKTTEPPYRYPHLRTSEEKDALLYGKQIGKFVTTGEIKVRKKREYKEAAEQSHIAGYIKKHYPDIPIETVKHEGKKKEWEQSQHSKQNTSDSFPDTRIYLPNVTLMIEQKAKGKSHVTKDGRIKDMHHQYQYNTHKRLFNDHRKVYFAVGISEAIEIFEQALRGLFRPMQVYKDCYEWEEQQRKADDFFKGY